MGQTVLKPCVVTLFLNCHAMVLLSKLTYSINVISEEYTTYNVPQYNIHGLFVQHQHATLTWIDVLFITGNDPQL